MTARERVMLIGVWILLGGGALFGVAVAIDAVTPSPARMGRPAAMDTPYWGQLARGVIIALVCGALAVGQTFEIIEGVRQRKWKWACPACGYDLRSNPDRCPECGAITPEEMSRRAHRRLQRQRDAASSNNGRDAPSN